MTRVRSSAVAAVFLFACSSSSSSSEPDANDGNGGSGGAVGGPRGGVGQGGRAGSGGGGAGGQVAGQTAGSGGAAGEAGGGEAGGGASGGAPGAPSPDAGAGSDAAAGGAPVAKSDLELPPDAEGDFDFSGKMWTYSAEWRPRAGDMAGTTRTDTFQSKTVYPGRSYKYSVWTPAQFDATKPAALMVWLDGELVRTGGAERLSNNMSSRGELPVAINLFVSPSSEANRGEEYDAVDDKYVRFLTTELIPEITTKYSLTITTNPDGHAIAGISSGGAAAFTAGWLRPDYFRRILTCSGSFVALRGADRYPELIRTTSPVRPLRVYLQSGDMDLSAFGGWGAANKKMAAALKERGYDYRMVYAREMRHEYSWCFQTLPFTLRFIWHGYTPQP